MQSIPPTTADKQTQAQKRRGSRSRKLLGAKAKSYRLNKCIVVLISLIGICTPKFIFIILGNGGMCGAHLQLLAYYYVIIKQVSLLSTRRGKPM